MNSKNKLIRLSNGPLEKPILKLLYDFSFAENEYLYVRHINDTETRETDDYFFMKVVKGENGEVGCEYVKDITLAYSLWSYIIKRFSLENVFNEG